jgi:uncharacterized phage protein (TIGR01671 family)
MRQIKFRAWDRQDKIMSELTQIHLGDYAPTISAWVPTKNDQTKLLVFGDNADLMQFTGLLDKKGKEIFEGDILHASQFSNAKESNREVGVVCWNEKLLAWYWNYQNGEGICPLWNGGSNLFCEVIGNIYENPELLE